MKPNILFILSDQHTPHIIGVEGNDVIHTPNLDKLASEGAYFSQCYCQNPLCVPSRSSLISGRYPKDLGIYDNMQILEANSVTMPRTFSEHGYNTCLIGKGHFNGEQFHGYQQRPYGDLYGQGHQPDPKRLAKYGVNGLGDVLENTGPSEMPEDLTQTELCVVETVKWLQTHKAVNKDNPFFLSVHFDKPHFPIKPPKRYFDKYHGKVTLFDTSKSSLDEEVTFVKEAILHNETGHHYGKDFDIQLRAKEAYYGCVEWIDDAIGRILDVLDYLELAENTIVIYTSDHGEMCGEHGTWQKTLFFESSVRVPLIMRWPGNIDQGIMDDAFIGLIDMFPTLCAAAGIKTPSVCDGENVLPTIKGEKLERKGVFSESAALNATQYAGCMYREGEWKYCYYLNGEEELYNLLYDPNEKENLISGLRNEKFVTEFREKTIEFWKPDEYLERLHATPIMSKEKHFYPFSNQYVVGDGRVIDARP